MEAAPLPSLPRFAFALLAGAAVMVASAVQAGEVRGVVELFTSQGCSSCPPADKLLGELADDPSLVALSLPVDYWDYLGWKDTLALRGHTKRQRAYSKTRGDREVFTPQAVISGSVYALGSDKAAIEQALTKSRDSGALTVPVQVAVKDGAVSITTTAAKEAAVANSVLGEIWLCPISRKVHVTIGRGENNGHSIVYHNVVRRWVKLGDWTGQPVSYSLPKASVTNGDAEIDAVAVLVQRGSASEPGPIVGAALAPLP